MSSFWKGKMCRPFTFGMMVAVAKSVMLACDAQSPVVIVVSIVSPETTIDVVIISSPNIP
jgi:hypothetical protein